MAEKLAGAIGRIVGFQLLGMMFVSMSFLVFGVFNDLIMSILYDVIALLVGQGTTDPWVLSFMSTVQETIFMIPGWIDLMWLVLFLMLVSEIWFASYFLKREGYLSSLGFLTFGMLVALFFMGVLGQMSDWFQYEFLGAILPTVTLAGTWVDLYSNNYLVANLFIIAIAIILNFIDFDMATFSRRKVKEKPGVLGDEVV